jgi:hypothetical protein
MLHMAQDYGLSFDDAAVGGASVAPADLGSIVAA